MPTKALPPIKTLIVDDEPLARETVRMLLKADADIEIVGECSNGQEAIETIQDMKPDLVFLDVQMPEIDGLGVMRALDPDEIPVVVFTTAYDQYALKAFEVHALDYLLKPYDDERFEQALNRAKEQVRQKSIRHLSEKLMALLDAQPQAAQNPAQVQSKNESTPIKRIMIKGSGPIFFLKVEEIDWIEAADYYVQLHVGSKCHLMRESLRNLEKQLDPNHFMRIHRSTIVNLERVYKLKPDARGDYQVILRDGTALKLGRGRREILQNKLLKSH